MNRDSRFIVRNSNAFLVYTFVIALPFSWASFAIGSVYRAVTLLLFALFLFEAKFIIIYSKEKRELFRSWILYLGYSMVTLFWAVDQEAAITNSMSVVLLSFIVVVFFSTELTLKGNNVVDNCWIIAGVICAALYIWGDKTSVGEYGSRTSMMIMGTATDPNEFASVFIVPLTLVLFNLLNKKGSRFLQIAFMIIAIYCILMSGSRGALLAMGVALFVTLVQSRKVDVRSVLIMLSVGILVLVFVVRYVVPMIPDDVLMRMSLSALLKDGGSGRGDIWTDALRKIWSGSPFRMFFGYGQYGLTVGTTDVTQTMHNQFIQQLSNYGMVGLVFYIVLVYKSYKAIKIYCPKYVGAFWGMMFMSLTITMSVAYKLLWILLLMPATMSKEDTRSMIADGK